MTRQANIDRGEGWILSAERRPGRIGEYDVQIQTEDGRILKDRLTWNGTDWRGHGNKVLYNAVAWYEEEPEEDGGQLPAGGSAGKDLTAGGTAGLRSLAEYEARIHLYKEQIGTGYIGIGRTLNEAKAAKVVPHGEWESWVERTTGLNIRQAQRCMRAATEIRDGSAMARLEMSKALMLLSSGLGREDQESLAEQAAEDGRSVKALREEIDRLKASMETERKDSGEIIRTLKKKVVEESGAGAEIRVQLQRAQAEREALAGQLEATAKAYQTRMDEESERSYLQGRKDAEQDVRNEIRKEYQGKLDFSNSRAKGLEEQLREMKEDLALTRAETSRKWDEGFQARETEIQEKEERIRKLEAELALAQADSTELTRAALEAKNREIDELQAELDAAEAREKKRADELAAMKKEKAQAGMDAARGIGAQAPGAMDLAAAVREFIGRAGVLPQMGGMIAGMSGAERDAILANVETVGKWVQGSLEALGIVRADARIL